MPRGQRGVVGTIVVFLVVLAVLAVAIGTAVKRRSAAPAAPAYAGPWRGVALTPKDFSAAGLADFYVRAAELGTSVSWHGDWNELAPGRTPQSFREAAFKAGLEPIVLVGTHTERQGKVEAMRPLTPETLASYRRLAADYAAKHKPRLLGLGNEVNSIAAAAPEEFETFVKLFNDTTDEVHRVSPDTKVFVTFQLERLKGLNGGLFGGTNDPSKQQWALLERFGKADILAFTSYPGLIYKTPEQIPAGYYGEISAKTTKPVAFTEVGWPAADVAAGWPSNPDTQARFARRFLADTKPLDPRFAAWLLMYDQNTAAAFKGMGLMDSSGQKRPAFDAWKSR